MLVALFLSLKSLTSSRTDMLGIEIQQIQSHYYVQASVPCIEEDITRAEPESVSVEANGETRHTLWTVRKGQVRPWGT